MPLDIGALQVGLDIGAVQTSSSALPVDKPAQFRVVYDPFLNLWFFYSAQAPIPVELHIDGASSLEFNFEQADSETSISFSIDGAGEFEFLVEDGATDPVFVLDGAGGFDFLILDEPLPAFSIDGASAIDWIVLQGNQQIILDGSSSFAFSAQQISAAGTVRIDGTGSLSFRLPLGTGGDCITASTVLPPISDAQNVAY